MLSLHDREWKEFFLRDVFPKIKRGKRLKTADHIEGSIPYVSSSAANNGIDAFIGNKRRIRKFSDCVTLANSGSVGKAFFHPYEFIASDHVTALQSSNLNKYSYIFVATMVERLQSKYSFNREINDLRINKEKVLLPIDEQGKPDYAFMEQYIREREQQIIQNYIDYIGTNIQAGGGVIHHMIKMDGCYLIIVCFFLLKCT
ncbi:MAG: restriction endonuclease subunit S, partial [Oscillospiraceae bacterium]|nr:restriction endonuclease subunit S [Oscillospiraceae bacterium]